MKRTIAGAAAAALGVAILTAAPAHASVYAENCRDFYDTLQNRMSYCVGVQYRNMAGPHGMIVDQVTAFVKGGDWENGNPPAISCTSFVIKNDAGDAKWVKTSGCNVTSNSNPAGPFILNGGDGLSMPSTDSVLVQYTGYLRLNNQPDPGDRTVAVTVTD